MRTKLMRTKVWITREAIKEAMARFDRSGGRLPWTLPANFAFICAPQDYFCPSCARKLTDDFQCRACGVIDEPWRGSPSRAGRSPLRESYCLFTTWDEIRQRVRSESVHKLSGH